MDPSELTSEEWSSLSGLYTAEEADFMSQLLGNFQVPENLYRNINMEIPSTLCNGHESTIVSLIGFNSASHFPQNDENSNSSIADTGNVFPTTSGGNCCLNSSVADFGYISMGDAKFNPYNVQGNDIQQRNEKIDEEFDLEIIGDKNFQAQKECEVLVSEPVEEDTTSKYLEKPGKRSRSSIEVLKNKKNVKSKKKPKSSFISNTEMDSSLVLQEQSLSSEDDDSKASQELNLNAGGSTSLSPKDSIALKLRGKSRPNKGSATDPQSIYAKKRRERINQKLRILQNLVPNGTKVDISTMLEEAVQYVNFLQLQIKLLSSDDLWMYSPIAYNGMNIGLNLNIPQPNNHRYLAHIKEDQAD